MSAQAQSHGVSVRAKLEYCLDGFRISYRRYSYFHFPNIFWLSMVFRSVVNERPQAIWRPVECSLGFASRDLHILPLIIGKLVGTVSWYFDCHARPSEKTMAQYLPKLRHQRKTADDGGRAA